MATYYVYSGAAGTNAGTSWINAYTAFGSAVTAATTAGDTILVHYTHQEQLTVDAEYVIGADSVKVVSVDKDSSDAPTVMGTGGWIGNSTLNRAVYIQSPNRKTYLYGITLRVGDGGSDACGLNSAGGAAGDGGSIIAEQCYLWINNTAGSTIALGGRGDSQSFTKLVNCTLRFGATGNTISVGNRIVIEGGGISSAGSAITTVFTGTALADNSGTSVDVMGFDFSAASATATMLGNNTVTPTTLKLSQCKLPTGAITYLATQTNVNRSSGEVYVFDCASGDTHGLFGYHNPLGSVVSDTGISYTSGAAGQSWKIVTGSAATFFTPFETPWISWYNAGTSSITPRIEILRDGSATAYNNDEVWGEFSAKTTTGFTLASLYSDRMAVLGSPAAQDSGTDTWDGENATHWAGKVNSGSAITPAEAGDIRARVCVGLASATVYVDPFIRT